MPENDQPDATELDLEVHGGATTPQPSVHDDVILHVASRRPIVENANTGKVYNFTF